MDGRRLNTQRGGGGSRQLRMSKRWEGARLWAEGVRALKAREGGGGRCAIVGPDRKVGRSVPGMEFGTDVTYPTSAPVAVMCISVVVLSLVFFSLYDSGTARAESLRDKDGRKYRLVSVPGDGNCGFHALAAGVNALQVEDPELVQELQESDVRSLLRKELESTPQYYQEKLEEFGVDAKSLQGLLDDVQQGGMDGHWLGARLGEMELMMLARALGLRIDVFTNDQDSVRCYQTHDYGKTTVGLLYSGSSDKGHFDLLVEVN